MLAYRSNGEDHHRWRCRGGDAGGASFALWLLSVSPARLRTLWAVSAGVLGGSRIARAAGSSPAPSKTCLVLCCCGVGGAAILEIAVQLKGGAAAGAVERSAWTSTATRAASVVCARRLMRQTGTEIQIWPGADIRTPTAVV